MSYAKTLIITLCGSATEESSYHKWNKDLTLLGHCVYSLGVFPSIEGAKNWYSEKEKQMLDLVHLRKISNSDVVLVVGSVGDSTSREILWAKINNKTIMFADSLSLQDMSYLGL